jgi:hypothetical protein
VPIRDNPPPLRKQLLTSCTSENIPTGDALEFALSIQDYKDRTGHRFPTWSEVLDVVKSLGYAKSTDSRGGDVPA